MKATSPKHQLIAKAGSLYLTFILTGIFAHFFVRVSIIEPGNAAVTAQNIMDKEFIFRLGFITDLTYIVSLIFLGLTFYRLFQQTDRNYARLLLALVLVTSIMLGANMLNQFAAQYVLSGVDYLNVFESEQLQAMSLFFLDLHNHGVHIGDLFFGLWLLPLGYLLIKSDLFPGVSAKIFGGLLLVGFVGYEIDFASYFLFPEKYVIISKFATIPADLGGVVLCFLLIIEGAIRKDKHRVVYLAINQKK